MSTIPALHYSPPITPPMSPQKRLHAASEVNARPPSPGARSDSADLDPPTGTLADQDLVVRSQSLTMSTQPHKVTPIRRKVAPTWDTLSAPRSSPANRLDNAPDRDENSDPQRTPLAKEPVERHASPRRSLLSEINSVTGQPMPARSPPEPSVGANVQTFYGGRSPTGGTSPKLRRINILGKSTNGILSVELKNHPGVRKTTTLTRAHPVRVEDVEKNVTEPASPAGRGDTSSRLTHRSPSPALVEPHTIGLPNIGMTCYMNSVLQCLFALPPFKASMKSMRRVVTEAVTAEPDLMDNVSVVRALADLIADRDDGKPGDIMNKISFLQVEFQKIRREFLLGVQQDSHEFLIQLYDAIEFQSMTLMANDPDIKCPVAKNFEFDVSHTKICQSCQKKIKSSIKDTVWKLSSPKPTSKDLCGLIQNSLTASVKSRCPECEANAKEDGVQYKESYASQLFHFESLPKMFVVHLPRMKYYKTSNGHYACDKIETPVEIPPILNMEELVELSDKTFERLENYTDIDDSFESHKITEEFEVDDEITFKRPLTPNPRPIDFSASRRQRNPAGDRIHRNWAADVPLVDSLTGDDLPSVNGSDDENGNGDSSSVEPDLLDGRESVLAVLLEHETSEFDSLPRMPLPTSPNRPSTPRQPMGSPESMDIDLELKSRSTPIEVSQVTPKLSEQLSIDVSSPNAQPEADITIPEAPSSVEDRHRALNAIFLDAVKGKPAPSSNGIDPCEEVIVKDSCDSTNLIESDSNFSSPARGGAEGNTSIQTEDEDSFQEVPEDLKALRTFSNQPNNPYFSYYLVGMVNHIGESVSSGHYKADVYCLDKEQWFRYDDERVSRMSTHQVLSENSVHGYLFVYLHKSYFKSTKKQPSLNDIRCMYLAEVHCSTRV
eukprot:maker-scaffold183_size276960-snap-gene-0.12 protein:Tk01747 transcript:maker-scaffold183_size276960-snap-gene-0.12-mRNA-1 annotation:"hypothetical protein EGM_10182"